MCRPAPPDPAEGIIARPRGSAREKYNPWGVSHEGKTTGRGYTPQGLRLPAPGERRHHVAREPGELLLELLRPHPLGPVDHHLVEARVLRLEVLDLLDDLPRRATQPRLLLDAVADAGNARRRARRAPRAPLGVGVAHEAERGEPLVALVVVRLHAADRLLLRVGEVEADAPAEIFSQREFPPRFGGLRL